ncbi:HAD-IIIC family phosphatase [Helicobacter kayseriensis]|uniref:HAD-IIIC family phosphatase n=1 Tax=Helicobacter kayseriensis TaxID=2905877 RepID=UPI001E352E74|nr:HAD-IIIC family phosphatase [Helicobacter kayseriensis]MCE3046675.1 HAD-IIIC family phosphatase [Helicobacter kayseriensis]MCE3048023.1 HAD-IIIC family phosphatase [Helicobacter kayseriensis]
MIDLYSKNLKRSDLLHFQNTCDELIHKSITINIHRNHAFEPVGSIINAFLSQSGLIAKFQIGPYDDSLSFDNLQKSHLEIIWVDLSRYKNNPLEHISKQIKYLKTLTTSPILPIFMDIHCRFNLSHLQEDNVLFLSSFIQQEDLDDKKSSITGTRLGNKACIKIAQFLGLREIPSLLLPSLKAIVLDLDNTLYSGILGEDGIDNLVLTQEHKKLQEKILDYKNKGFLLALASKNEEQHVQEMFHKRKDFPLQWKDFDTKEVNWNPKSQNIQKIAQFFNFGLDSLLFIDDNIAEIESVKSLNIKTILAISPTKVLETLELFPQMHKKAITNEDILRSADIQANQLRQQLSNLSQKEYFQNLQISLIFSIDNLNNIQRITELLNKTNQFISGYTRPTLNQVEEWFRNPHLSIATIAMSDKLSDSGIIAIFIGEKIKHQLALRDLCISCRALGRKLEEIMLFKAISLLKEKLGILSPTTDIYFKKGERNSPFLDFLQKLPQHSASQNIYTTIDEIVNTDGLNIKEEKNERF